MLPLLPVLPADSQYVSPWCAGTMLPLLPVGRQTCSIAPLSVSPPPLTRRPPPLCQKGGFEGGGLGERRTVPVRCGAPIPSSLPLHAPRGCRARGTGVMTGGVARLIPCPMMDGVGGWGIDVLSVRDVVIASTQACLRGLPGSKGAGRGAMRS